VARQLPLPTILGVFHLRTHLNRLADGNELVFDCPGDEVRLGGGRGFLRAPCFYGLAGRVYLGAHHVGDHDDGTSAPGSFVIPG
jgi:hypothetical protein